MVKWPIYGSNFNTRDYCSLQLILSDLEAIIRITLKDRLDISESDYKVSSCSSKWAASCNLTSYNIQNYSVVLVIPDFYERAYVREFVNLLLVLMGFKQVCAQQVGISS